MTNILTITPETCTNIKGQIYKICLPEKVYCYNQNVEGLITDCDNVYNCNRCQTEPEYYIPFFLGDKLMIQTQLADTYNSDKRNPTAGWGTAFTACLVGSNGTLTDVTQFTSRRFIGWGCKQTFQVLEIDTSLFPDDCFKIQIAAVGGSEVCTQEFRRVNSCNKTLLIESIQTGKDCLNNCYDLPSKYVGDSFKYSNKIRLRGSIYKTGITTTYDGKKKVIRDNYKLNISDIIPEFMLNYVVKQLFGSNVNDEYPEIIVDGETYYFDGVNTQNRLTDSHMFLVSFDLFRECKDIKKCR